MKVYSLTKTLDDFVDFYTNDPSEAEVIVVGGSKIELEKYPKLKYIFKCGVGVDNIPDIEGTGVELVMPSETTKYKIYGAVSTFTVHSIMSGYYRTVGSMSPWEKNEKKDLFDNKLFVIGKGNIGDFVIDKMERFVKNIEVYDKYRSYYSDNLEQKTKNADIITVHVPFTEETKGIVDLSLVKDDVIIVNTSRAGLFDEDELYDFLKSHPNATAVFDVFWKEPYEGKLLELENFIATPHIASMGKGFKEGLHGDLLELLRKKK